MCKPSSDEKFEINETEDWEKKQILNIALKICAN